MSYSPETVAAIKAYATSLRPTPRPQYQVVHHWNASIQVPSGYLPIRVAQFYRGERSAGGHKLYHWAIFIPTSTRRGFGNFYEIAGSLETGYFTQNVVNNRHSKWDPNERGSHLAGYVALNYLERLEAHFSVVPVVQGRADWNCQTWVVEALKGLNNSQNPYVYAIQMDHGQWRQQMDIVEAAWNVGDA